MNRTLHEIAEIVGGRLLSDNGDFRVQSVSIDSRRTAAGCLFFALGGTRRDGHEFVGEVVAAGGAAVVSRPIAGVDPGRLLLVEDVTTALQELARYHRMTTRVPVIAVTGSVGKTTTKDLIAACLAQQYGVLKSEANYNNELGLPLTLLAIEEQHQVAVVEMGMRGRGQIAQLARLARPQAAVITNVAPVHLELLGSLENIAAAKCEVLDYIAPGGFALINGDSELLSTEASRHDAPIYTFGRQGDHDVSLLDVREEPGGLTLRLRVFDEVEELYVPLLSEDLALNTLAAVAMARQWGVTWPAIRQAVRQFAPGGHRLRTVEVSPGLTVIDDCYNANPLSMVAALQVMARQKRGQQGVAVLGDMFELGALEKEAHLQVGREAARLADRLVTVGKRARWIAEGAIEAGLAPDRIEAFDDNGQAISFLKEYAADHAVILIKGSRGMQMEEIVEALTGRKPV